MRVTTLDDGQHNSTYYTIPSTVNRESLKIALIGWYPVYKSGTSYPEKNYSIYLISDEDKIYRLTIIYFDPSKNKSSEWRKINPVENVFEIPPDINSFKIFNAGSYDELLEDNNTYKTYIPNPKFIGWKYHIILMEKGENIKKGNVEDLGHIDYMAFSPENVTKEYCKKSSYSRTSDKYPLIGSVCPVNPVTKKEMKECLIWRRLDDVGKSCRDKNFLSEDDIENSIFNFCQEKPDREDCLCINRVSQEDYQKNKKFNSAHDYCWYIPCATRSYLFNPKETHADCKSQYCNTIVYGSGNSVDFNENYINQDCFNADEKQINNNKQNNHERVYNKTTSNINEMNFDKKYIVMLLIGIVLVLVLNLLTKKLYKK